MGLPKRQEPPNARAHKERVISTAVLEFVLTVGRVRAKAEPGEGHGVAVRSFSVCATSEASLEPFRVCDSEPAAHVPLRELNGYL